MSKLSTSSNLLVCGVLLTVITNCMKFSFQPPLYPAEAHRKGLSPTSYGAVMGIYMLTYMIFSFLAGQNISRIGVKKCYITGNIICATCSILFSFLCYIYRDWQFFLFSLCIRFIEGIGYACHVVSLVPLLTSLSPDNAGFLLSLVQTCLGVGMSIGPAFGGWLSDVGGFNLAFSVAGVLVLMAIAFSSTVIKLGHFDKIKTVPKMSSTSILKIPSLWVGLCSPAIHMISYGFIMVTLEPHTRIFNLTGASLGFLFAVGSISYSIVVPICGRLLDKGIHPRILMTLGALLMCIGFIVIGPIPGIHIENRELWYVKLGLIIVGIGGSCQLLPGLFEVQRVLQLSGYVLDEETLGLCSGMWSSALSFGGFLGPIISGVMYDTIGFRYCNVAVVALNGVFSSFVFCLYVAQRIKVSEKDPLLPKK